MSTLTDKLGLKIPAPTDPFLRQDYEDALVAIDRAPGVHYCTSTTRPTWSSGQDGRLIFETDTRRFLSWTGSAWLVVLQPSNGWLLYSNYQQTLNPSTAYTRSVGSVTTSEPGTLIVQIIAQLGFDDGYVQGANVAVKINDVDVSVGSSYIRANSPTGATLGGVANRDYKQGTALGYATVAAGTHTVKALITIDEGDSNPYLSNVRASVFLVNSTLDGSV